jgi:hypothetical protein
MNRLARICAFLVVPFLFACSSSNNNNNNNDDNDASPAQLRVTHASPDAPAVNVYIDGTLALEAVEYKQSSGLISFDEPGTLEVEVRGILADGSEVTVIGPAEITLEESIRTDIVAYDTVFDNAGALNIKPAILDPVTIEDDITDVRVTVLHAAPNVGAVDIYVTAPGDDIANTTPIDADFGDAAGPVALEADTDYQVRITPDGDNTVVYDSGSLTFPAGTELVLIAVENTFKVGANPVNLLAVGPEGAAEVMDVDMGAEVRVVHNSGDTPPVDVLINGTEVIDALTFPSATAYDDVQAPPGTYNVVIAADADNTIAPIDADLTLEQTLSYTAIAIGSLTEDTIEPLLTVDERRNVATEAIVRVVHGSYLVAAEIPVDVYLTPDGVIADADPAIAGLAYKEFTDQLSLPPGDYWITVTAAGDKSVVAFDTGGVLPLEGGVNYTIIARDPSAEEVSGLPLIRVTLLTD